MSDTVRVDAEQRPAGLQAPTTPQAQHDQLVNNVQETVQGHTPGFDVRPVTPETPVPDSPAMKQVGAERVGSHQPSAISEEMEYLERDTRHALGSMLRGIFGGKTEKRMGPKGGSWFNTIKERVTRRSKVGKIDYSSHDPE